MRPLTIDATDGQLKSKTGVMYNFESTKKSYTVVVTVHDGKDAAGGTDTTTIDDEITVTINLTNVNEKPALTSPPGALSVPENSTAVHSYAATDVDADTVFSWSLNRAPTLATSQSRRVACSRSAVRQTLRIRPTPLTAAGSTLTS